MLMLVRFVVAILCMSAIALAATDSRSLSALTRSERQADIGAALVELGKSRLTIASRPECQQNGVDCAAGLRTLAAAFKLDASGPVVQQAVVYARRGASGEVLTEIAGASTLPTAGRTPLCDVATGRVSAANVAVLVVRQSAVTAQLERQVRASAWMHGSPSTSNDSQGCSVFGAALRDELLLTVNGTAWRLWTVEATGSF